MRSDRVAPTSTVRTPAMMSPMPTSIMPVSAPLKMMEDATVVRATTVAPQVP